MVQSQKPMRNLLLTNKAYFPKLVYLEIFIGSLFSFFLKRLYYDPRYTFALYVQYFGLPNEIPYKLYEKKFINSESNNYKKIYNQEGFDGIDKWLNGIEKSHPQAYTHLIEQINLYHEKHNISKKY